MSEIASVTVTRLEIPLAEPYHLSHTTVEALDTVLVTAHLENGAEGVGEATTLEGYSSETIEDVWSQATAVGSRLPGHDIDTAFSVIREELEQSPFAQAGLDSAVTTTKTDKLSAMSVPLVGILSTGADIDETMLSLETQLAAGFETLKVKIGFDPDQDAQRLNEITTAVPEEVSLRVDANQGYTIDQARRFLDAAPTDRLQLLEQPLPVGHLDGHAALRGDYDVTIMLDEEIRKSDDIREISDAAAADAVKFKLMKMGSWEGTRRAIRQARSQGLEIVLGNGVQSDIGCLHEATLWDDTDLKLAGEFNGWRKQRQGLLRPPVGFADGELRWSEGTPSLNRTAIESYRVENEQYPGE